MVKWIKSLFEVENKTEPDLFSDNEIEYYLLAVYHGIITRHLLSVEYHVKLSQYLTEAVYKGYGHNIMQVPFTSSAYRNLQDLRRSVYMFSAAKQYSQVREMSDMIDLSGVEGNFKEFREKAGQVFETYNKTYLKTEYDTAVLQSEMAMQWQDIEETKDTLPMLRYHTQRDDRVRPHHAILDGITRPVDDPFWNTFYPPCGWHCRCFVTQHSEKIKESGEIPEIEWGTKEFPKTFRLNSGKDGYIFNPKFHPYFQVAPGDSQFKKAGYGLQGI